MLSLIWSCVGVEYAAYAARRSGSKCPILQFDRYPNNSGQRMRQQYAVMTILQLASNSSCCSDVAWKHSKHTVFLISATYHWQEAWLLTFSLLPLISQPTCQPGMWLCPWLPSIFIVSEVFSFLWHSFCFNISVCVLVFFVVLWPFCCRDVYLLRRLSQAPVLFSLHGGPSVENISLRLLVWASLDSILLMALWKHLEAMTGFYESRDSCLLYCSRGCVIVGVCWCCWKDCFSSLLWRDMAGVAFAWPSFWHDSSEGEGKWLLSLYSGCVRVNMSQPCLMKKAGETGIGRPKLLSRLCMWYVSVSGYVSERNLYFVLLFLLCDWFCGFLTVYPKLLAISCRQTTTREGEKPNQYW